MSLPLYNATPSDRLLALTREEKPEAPTYQEVGALWNTYKNGTDTPNLADFGQWVSGTGKYEGRACQVTW